LPNVICIENNILLLFARATRLWNQGAFFNDSKRKLKKSAKSLNFNRLIFVVIFLIPSWVDETTKFQIKTSEHCSTMHNIKLALHQR
jgi:hypothetical protein